MEHQLIEFIQVIMVLIVGLSIGSFITMASYRLPFEQEIIYTPSYCTKCNHKLTVKDLFPLFSWICNRGKCTYCYSKISIRYPIIEVIFSIISFSIYKKYGFTFESLIVLLIALCLLIAIVTDFEHYIIPDQIQIALAIIAILYNVNLGTINFTLLISPIITLLTGICLRKVIYLWKKQDPLGFGDIKLLAVSGLYISPNTIPIYLLVSGIMGIITWIIWQILGKGKIFPFGPALAISLFVCIINPQISNAFDNMIIKFIFKIRDFI